MSVTYSQTAIDARLQAVANLLNGGQLVLSAGPTTICIITLGATSGTVSGGVFTITIPAQGVASATGTVTNASLLTSLGVGIVTGLTVGIPLSSAEVIIFNGINSTTIQAAQSVQILGAQIIGS